MQKSLFRRGDSAFAFVAGDYAVTDMDDAIGVLGDVSFVSDKDDGMALAVKLFHQLHDFIPDCESRLPVGSSTNLNPSWW
jgi:hypothetical protein